jgi:hypothetical protein
MDEGGARLVVEWAWTGAPRCEGRQELLEDDLHGRVGKARAGDPTRLIGVLLK